MLVPIPDTQKASEPHNEKKYFVDVVFQNGTRFSIPASDKANIPIKAREFADFNNWRARCKKYSVVTVDNTVTIEEISQSDTNYGAKQTRLCKFGTNCKLGAACRFVHPDGQAISTDGPKKPCKNGATCKYGASCKFDHSVNQVADE
jgi:hypothetical protein